MFATIDQAIESAVLAFHVAHNGEDYEALRSGSGYTHQNFSLPKSPPLRLHIVRAVTDDGQRIAQGTFHAPIGDKMVKIQATYSLAFQVNKFSGRVGSGTLKINLHFSLFPL